MTPPEPTLRDVYLARQLIGPIARTTPLIGSPQLADVIGAPVCLKLENTQETGSFKVRGAANRVLSLTDEERARGIVAVSTGNHGRAVSYVARELDVNATVCMTRRVPANKVEAIERLGAQVVIGGEDQAEAEDRVRRLQREQGSVLVHPYDDPWVIAGQGTIGLELLDEVPDVDTVLVPLSGGGLISGIALALKSASPSIRVVGVTMEGGAAMHRSLQAGKVVDVVEEDTLADALAGGLGSPNRYTFNMCRRYVDGTVLVSEDEIAEAMVFCLEEHHLVVEGGGAVGVAALLHRKVQPGENTVVVISGGNVDPSLLMRVVKERS